jgi:cytochrome c553
MKISTVLGVLVLSLCTGLAQAAGDPVAGKEKAQTCMGCHGIPGYRNAAPEYHVPKLGGQHAEYIIAALKAYKAGQRNHPTMRAQASTLSDQDMADIAAYFSNMKANKAD